MRRLSADASAWESFMKAEDTATAYLWAGIGWESPLCLPAGHRKPLYRGGGGERQAVWLFSAAPRWGVSFRGSGRKPNRCPFRCVNPKAARRRLGAAVGAQKSRTRGKNIRKRLVEVILRTVTKAYQGEKQGKGRNRLQGKNPGIRTGK